jgi:hypothetical protein
MQNKKPGIVPGFLLLAGVTRRRLASCQKGQLVVGELTLRQQPLRAMSLRGVNEHAANLTLPE